MLKSRFSRSQWAQKLNDLHTMSLKSRGLGTIVVAIGFFYETPFIQPLLNSVFGEFSVSRYEICCYVHIDIMPSYLYC